MRQANLGLDLTALVLIGGPVESFRIANYILSSRQDGIPHSGCSGIFEAWLNEVELTFANAMHQLNACQSDRGVPEAFEAEHDVRSGLDVAMILLDEIIQILRGSDLRILGQQAVRLHLAHGAVRGCIGSPRSAPPDPPL